MEADQNYEGYVKVGTDPAEVPAQIENGAVIKVNYDVDSEQTKDLSYTVQHIVDGKVKDTFTETVTVQVLQPDTIARNEALEADQNYEGYVKVGTDPAEVPAQIENGAVIKVNYDVDSEQTKDLSYTVQHIVEGKVKDTFTESVTVQVLQPDTIARNEALEADQNYEGYVKVGTDPAEVPAIKVNYDVDSEQTKDLSYTVQHIVDGKVKDTFTESVTVQVLQPDTIARNEALEADQNYEGYVKVGTDPAEVPAQIENGAVIKVNYEVQSYNYKVSHIYRDAEDKVVEDLTTTSETRDYLSAISESPRPATSGNFVLTNVEVESQDQSTLKSDQNGNVTGTMPAEDLTITFNYSADENQDEIPDKYQITVTYRAVNGTITANNGPFTLNKVDANGNYAVDGVAHLTDGQIAKASPNNGYQGGTWSPMSPTTTLDLTDDTTFTITFTATPTDPDEPNPGCPEGTVWDEAAQACLAPFVPGPEPFVPGPGPVNPGPEEEVIVEPETPEQGGTATPTPTPEIEEIEEPEQPEVGHKGSWALINLIASLLGLLAALFLIFAKHQKDDDEEDQNQSAAMNEEDPEQLKRKRIYKWISGLTAVVSIIVFVLTENMRLPMILVDKWTLLMVVFFLINAVTLYLGRRWHENEDDEEQTQA
ncbi:hypothetical protein GKE08_11665 [Holdemania massiliensis]|uniref:Uncharacterized protein n=1 Tax=Holdemania massiliensis TaxID=1468449 RepID=A0A6N7S8P0_9FIRM|nr:hypothetical protein [Holdemania massiliensis]